MDGKEGEVNREKKWVIVIGVRRKVFQDYGSEVCLVLLG
jgi:hypothetical protein